MKKLLSTLALAIAASCTYAAEPAATCTSIKMQRAWLDSKRAEADEDYRIAFNAQKENALLAERESDNPDWYYTSLIRQNAISISMMASALDQRLDDEWEARCVK
jgi:hypothetical protein